MSSSVVFQPAGTAAPWRCQPQFWKQALPGLPAGWVRQNPRAQPLLSPSTTHTPLFGKEKQGELRWPRIRWKGCRKVCRLLRTSDLFIRLGDAKGRHRVLAGWGWGLTVTFQVGVLAWVSLKCREDERSADSLVGGAAGFDFTPRCPWGCSKVGFSIFDRAGIHRKLGRAY